MSRIEFSPRSAIKLVLDACTKEETQHTRQDSHVLIKKVPDRPFAAACLHIRSALLALWLIRVQHSVTNQPRYSQMVVTYFGVFTPAFW